MRLLFIVMFLLFVNGCSTKAQKSLQALYTENSETYKNLQQTQKVLLSSPSENDHKLFLSINYLNSLSNKQEEIFLLACYSEESLPASCQEIIETMTLNGQRSKKIETLSYEEATSSEMTFAASWGLYRKLSFPSVKQKQFMLSSGSTEIPFSVTFSKEPKYLIGL